MSVFVRRLRFGGTTRAGELRCSVMASKRISEDVALNRDVAVPMSDGVRPMAPDPAQASTDALADPTMRSCFFSPQGVSTHSGGCAAASISLWLRVPAFP
jgi:hypothetical protein